MVGEKIAGVEIVSVDGRKYVLKGADEQIEQMCVCVCVCEERDKKRNTHSAYRYELDTSTFVIRILAISEEDDDFCRTFSSVRLHLICG